MRQRTVCRDGRTHNTFEQDIGGVDIWWCLVTLRLVQLQLWEPDFDSVASREEGVRFRGRINRGRQFRATLPKHGASI